MENRKHDDNPLVIDFWEGELTGHRMHFKNAPDGSRRLISKLNDVHFVSKICRNLILDEALASVLAELLGGDPLAIETLTFEKESEQEDHFDPYYMPAPSAEEMVVSSIFLEKVGTRPRLPQKLLDPSLSVFRWQYLRLGQTQQSTLGQRVHSQGAFRSRHPGRNYNR